MPCCGLGADLIKMGQKKALKIVQRPSERADNGLRMSCPECGWEITSKFSWCPQCGMRTKPYQCAYCRGWVPIDLGICPRCGAPEH